MAGYLPLFLVPAGWLITFLTFRYRNRIAYDFFTIDMHVPEDNAEITIMGGKRLNAERLSIKNYGIRSLENVELHLSLATQPISINVKQPSTLSASVIKTEWENEKLKISVPNLPSGERFEIDLFRVGWSHYDKFPLRGTGGKYEVVGRERYEVKRAFFKDIGWFMLVGFFAYIAGLVVNYTVKPISDPAPIEATSKKVGRNGITSPHL